MNTLYTITLKNPPTHPRLTVPLVCKAWNALSKSYLWRTLILREMEPFRRIALVQHLLKNTSLRPLVRRLVVLIWKNDLLAHSILDMCRSIRVLNYTNYTPTYQSLDLIMTFPVEKVCIRFPNDHDGDETWVHRYLTAVNHNHLASLHVGLNKVGKSTLLLPFFLSWTIPHLRLSLLYEIAPSGDWQASGVQPLVELCQNVAIKYLEICSVDNDFLSSLNNRRLRISATKPGHLRYSLQTTENETLEKVAWRRTLKEVVDGRNGASRH